MDDLSRYARRPFGFYLRYVRLRPFRHAGILLAGFLAAISAVGTQYAIKLLVDRLSQGAAAHGAVWFAFGLLISLVAADHLLSRLAGVIASLTFPQVTADLRSDLFRHLAGHGPRYFADRLPGTLTSRITATSNAVFTLENMFAWNVLPPIVGNVGAVLVLASVSLPVTAGLVTVALVMVLVIFRLAAAARPLHRAFADKAAAVDGEVVDVIGNMAIVRAFGGIRREGQRVREALDREAGARRRSLLFMDRLRTFHSLMVVAMMVGLLAWAITLWQRGAATTGDVVLVCTLGFSILQATRELAYAFVDVTQHMARLAEAIGTILLPHEIRDHPSAVPIAPGEGAVVFENVGFAYPGGTKVFEGFNLNVEPGQRVGLDPRPPVGRADRPWRGRRGLRERRLRLSRRHQGFRGLQPERRARPACRAGRRIGRREIHRLRPAAAILRSRGRPHPDRRPGHRAGDPGEPARADRRGAPGYLALPPLDHGQHSLRPARSHGRGSRRRRSRGALPRLHRGSTPRLRHGGRRARRQAFRRPAPADRDRARLPQERADPAAGRGDLGPRYRIRGSDPHRPRPADARAHGHRDCPPPVDPARLRPDCRAAGGTNRGGRAARSAHAPGRRLPPADRPGNRPPAGPLGHGRARLRGWDMAREAQPALDQRHLTFRFWESASGFWRGQTAQHAWSLSAALVAIVLLQLLVQYGLNYWYRNFFDALGRRDASALWTQFLVFLPLVSA